MDYAKLEKQIKDLIVEEITKGKKLGHDVSIESVKMISVHNDIVFDFVNKKPHVIPKVAK